LTAREAYEQYGKNEPAQFDIWGSNQPDIEQIRKKKAAERAAREAAEREESAKA
jgi:hypothetical protein